MNEELGNIKDQDKQAKQLIWVALKESEDCICILMLMGIPVVKESHKARSGRCVGLVEEGICHSNRGHGWADILHANTGHKDAILEHI